MCQNCFSASSSAASSSAKIRRSMISADMIDGLLAGAGYKVLSSELWQVARCLETVMVNAPTEVSHLANDAIHYNGTTHRTWPPGSTHSSPSSTSPKNRTRPVNLLGSEPDGHRKLPTGTKIEEDSGIGINLRNREEQTGRSSEVASVPTASRNHKNQRFQRPKSSLNKGSYLVEQQHTEGVERSSYMIPGDSDNIDGRFSAYIDKFHHKINNDSSLAASKDSSFVLPPPPFLAATQLRM
ncbi:hypothetical protein RJ640_029507 [Escallonia rubra]|uniref:Transcriptional factor DELLA N-terminal domain-containing protein n=1 Tax=Escallonia rubra TaxID=112253 RepID=A0AA88S1J5_9ASTE|nr:hypothetical protein RJ640_029507 [Escallonia rubra]